MYIFLDDHRNPGEVTWVAIPELPEGKNWHVVRNYEEFIHIVKDSAKRGIRIEAVSFDHDLGFGHGLRDADCPTGLHCARFLTEVVLDMGWEPPTYVVHSMNPVGKRNIEFEMIDLRRRYEMSKE